MSSPRSHSLALALSALAVLAVVSAPIAAAAAATSHSDELRWFTWGDWGATSSNEKHQAEVASAMDDHAKSWEPDVLITTGDNFYNDGVTSTSDPQWTDKWQDVYMSHKSLQLPFYACLGNHDYIENPQAQVEYSQAGMGNGLWIMPERYYTHTFEFGTQTAQFVFIDTIMLATATTLRVADEELADGEITPAMHAKLAARLAADAVPYNGTQQLEWLASTLAASTADWLFVVGHFPVYSGGHHGNTPELVEQVMPLLEKYNVDAYLDGHSHTLQALMSNGVYYYVSGAGSKMASSMTQLPQTLYGVANTLGFATMKLKGDILEMEYRGKDNNVLYAYNQTVRPKA